MYGCSQNFFKLTLKPVMDDPALRAVINLRYFPWGFVSSSGQCQHGIEECKVNTITSCANFYGSADQSYEFALCLETQSGHLTAAEGCANSVGLSWAALNTCATGPEVCSMFTCEIGHIFNARYSHVPF